MPDRKKRFHIILIVISAALVGLVCLQVVLLNNAYNLRRQALERNVNAALTSVAQELETRETVRHTFDRLAVEGIGEADSVNVTRIMSEERVLVVSDTLKTSRGAASGQALRLTVSGGRLSYNLPDSQHVRVQMFTDAGEKLVDLVDDTKPAGEHNIAVDSTLLQKGAVFVGLATDTLYSMYQFSKSGDMSAVWKSEVGPGNQKQRLVTRILADIDLLNRVPIEQRIAPASLDSLLQTRLAENTITMPYAFGVISAQNDVRITNRPDLEDMLPASPFRTRLFPFEPFSDRYDLALHFPDESMYVLQQMGGLFAATVILVSLIILSFIYTVRTIFRQQRFAATMTDFVNNMTHEFKTPISTIALATETMSKPAAQDDRERMARYVEIIRDENVRMRDQVDKILQMAVLENREYELKITAVDVHTLLRDAVQKVALQIEQRSGNITEDLQASNAMIRADVVHLAGIIHNLLDNANKYSPETPIIEVGTRDAAEGIRIYIKDNGIGMSLEDQKHAFDKYYRVSTGNVHDVKGFGLGLSYVKMMVEAHGGHISLAGEQGRGTEVSLYMPFEPEENSRDGQNEHSAD